MEKSDAGTACLNCFFFFFFIILSDAIIYLTRMYNMFKLDFGNYIKFCGNFIEFFRNYFGFGIAMNYN